MVERWLAKTPGTGKLTDVDSPITNEVIIERNTIVLLNIKVGRGDTATHVLESFCVVEVYEA